MTDSRRPLTPADLRRIQSDAKHAVGKQIQSAAVEQAVARLAAAKSGQVMNIPTEHVQYLQCPCGETYSEPLTLVQFARDAREGEASKIGSIPQQFFRCPRCKVYMRFGPKAQPEYLDLERVEALYQAGRTMGMKAAEEMLLDVLQGFPETDFPSKQQVVERFREKLAAPPAPEPEPEVQPEPPAAEAEAKPGIIQEA